ncbi:MAG: hypothetical protein OXO54_09125 [Chloroflexota bacterium]|nr:hypothetical protein [Chloroflexota bacterium]MDE2898470.1 hypothetical protein [Chloroflexota bacterium]
MALTREQARELRSLMQSWTRASNDVAEHWRGVSVSSDGLDLKALRTAVDRRTEAEELLMSFWSRTTAA